MLASKAFPKTNRKIISATEITKAALEQYSETSLIATKKYNTQMCKNNRKNDSWENSRVWLDFQSVKHTQNHQIRIVRGLSSTLHQRGNRKSKDHLTENNIDIIGKVNLPSNSRCHLLIIHPVATVHIYAVCTLFADNSVYTGRIVWLTSSQTTCSERMLRCEWLDSRLDKCSAFPHTDKRSCSQEYSMGMKKS